MPSDNLVFLQSIKKKIAFVSTDFFADVDMPILPIVAEKYNIHWFVILSNKARFDSSFLLNFAANNNIILTVYKLNGRRRNLSNTKLYLRIFFDLIRGRFDVVYYEYIMDPYTFLLSLFISRNKKILALHDVAPHSNFEPKSQIFLLKLAIFSFSKFQTFSKSQAEFLKTLYKKKSYVIPLAKKESGSFTNIRPIYAKHIKLLFFGGIYSYKRLDLLIQAFENVLRFNNCHVTLTIAGNGPDWVNCLQYIKTPSYYQLRIEFIPQNDIPNLFNSHHFLLLPYKDVTQSGPLFDAFNYNLPAIASNELGFSEFINDGVTGFLFETNSLSSLIQILDKCLKLTEDDYNTISSNLKEFSRFFNNDNVARKYIEMFNDIIYA